MKTQLLLMSLFFAAAANAERIPARNFGLTPETGYLEAVTPDEECDPSTNVRVEFESNGVPSFIRRCDGGLIGWVSRTVDPADLGPDQQSNDQLDAEIKLGVVYDRFGNDAINIYTCDESRRDELEQFPEVTPAKDAEATYNQLMALKAAGRPFTLQLFYNEFVYSGKCIGAVGGLTSSLKKRTKFAGKTPRTKGG